jgi:hypothetical protein
MTKLPLTISEHDFQDQVFEIAKLRGWHIAHFRHARTNAGWRTPMSGHPGFPDLVLARNGTVLIRELKTQHGRLSPGQQSWAQHLGESYETWRPSDFDHILGELR